MSAKYHVSQDGVVRVCTAKTAEACLAKGLNGERAVHFDNENMAKSYVAEYYERKHGVFRVMDTEDSLKKDFESMSADELYSFANESEHNHKILREAIDERIIETCDKYENLEKRNPHSSKNPVNVNVFKEMRRDFNDFNDTTAFLIESYTQSRFYRPKFIRKNIKNVGISTKSNAKEYDVVNGGDIMVLIDRDFSETDMFSKLKIYGLKNSKINKVVSTSKVSKKHGNVYRDSVWRDRLKNSYAEDNPNIVLISSDNSYLKNGSDWQQAGFDGVVVNPSLRKQEGLLKIKTGVEYDEWGESLPVSLKGEALYYLDTTGLEYADVLVLNNKNESKVFRVHKDEELIPGVTMRDYIDEKVEPWLTDIKNQRARKV